MNSIDKLREYAGRLSNSRDPWSGMARDLLSIADAIEREVEQYVVAEIDVLPMTDENMAAAGWVRLPVDADGEPIHVGDVMEWRYGNGEFEVIGIGGNTLFYIDKDSNECEWTAAGDKRHHRAPTVEDVILDAISRCVGHSPEYWDKPIAECAAKLRLAGDE